MPKSEGASRHSWGDLVVAAPYSLRTLAQCASRPTQASCNTSRPRLRSTQDPRCGWMRNGGHVTENSHLAIRRRERKQQKFKSQGSAQRFLSSHAAIYNTFNTQPHLISRPGLRTLRAQAHQAWAVAAAAA
jgi:putative transposase